MRGRKVFVDLLQEDKLKVLHAVYGCTLGVFFLGLRLQKLVGKGGTHAGVVTV